MKIRRISRRKFLATSMLATSVVLVGDARLVEPDWLKVRHLRIGKDNLVYRFVHFSDVHHKGDIEYLDSVVETINTAQPDFVCFTGDIVEKGKYLAEALDCFSKIKAPVFGVPGNHDYWSDISFSKINASLNANGGAWLLDKKITLANGQINLIGITCNHGKQAMMPLDPSAKNILLMHYPAWVNKLNKQKFDLMLAGHSHGGQVRIPFYGPLVVPHAVDQYDLGLFQTASGPLYVSSGIGYLENFRIRFNCRPEITVIEI